MEDNVEAAYDATTKPRAYAGIFDYGLKFTPYPGAANNKEQWLAIKFRVPTAGEYSVKYLIGTDASYSEQGKTYILPGDANIAIDENYLSLGATSFKDAGNAEHNGNGTITATSANQEFILIFYPNANAAMSIKSFTLVRKEEKLDPEYTYNFLPAKYGTEGTNDYLDVYSAMAIKDVNKYTSSDPKLNWQYGDMHPDFETSYDGHSAPRKLAGITPDFGLKFTPLGSNNTQQWLAIKFRVPTAGEYSVKYES